MRTGAGRGIGELSWVMVRLQGERRTVLLIARDLLAWLGHLTTLTPVHPMKSLGKVS